ncbi:aminotransferase class I/II-fold pyridoxal phosphate-dependent enzyme [Tepidicella baoligensis]|uniref:aminotransferase class I/II-fold pyridoxal phosphate-dependent enzyme n=1 Tax=Tepidicella baoligensis TaxID=2707016 RepID=UPI0015DA6C02|nr:aminotransferase class I/II-fold pyridoxal phosphate-dependent enzyme [Tepidicella baoligensis]
MTSIAARTHGGTDAHGPVRWDFSSNANACGPCPIVVEALRAVDAIRYPDPSYGALRRILAQWHGVEPGRILIGGSASEWIQRLTACAWRHGIRSVWWPTHAYGDYAHAAAAWGMRRALEPGTAGLAWLCEPSSPLGDNESSTAVAVVVDSGSAWTVLDCAYQPLRLSGQPTLTPAQQARCWQLWSPNKALGLTGVRAAYLIVPEGEQGMVQALEALAPSWPVGSHGVALLQHWTMPEVQQWLRDSLPTLQRWKDELVRSLVAHGWDCRPSHTPYFCARPPAPLSAQALRRHDIKLRDATSFGLPGRWRLSAQPDAARHALLRALEASVPNTQEQA